MASTSKKRKRPTKDVNAVSNEDKPLTKKGYACTFTSASSSKSKEPAKQRAPAIKSKAAVVPPRMTRSNKGKLLLMTETRMPIITRSKKQLLSMQKPSTLDVQHSRKDPSTIPFARKWSNKDELRILRGLQEHRKLHGKQPDLEMVYDKIIRDGSFDNQDAGIPKFKDKVRKLLKLYNKMASMKDPTGDDHKIELFKIGCNVWGDPASNAQAQAQDQGHAQTHTHTHGLVASSETTTTSFCADSRDGDNPSQWPYVALWWGSRIAFLVAFAALMSPGWRKRGYKEFMDLGGLLP